jgi:DMSO/TMAO reductase YedYZ heme-binding membrane subunit
MIQALVYFVAYVLVLGIVAWLLIYIVDQVPMLAPFKQVARLVITVVAVFILIILLLGLIGLVDTGTPRLLR